MRWYAGTSGYRYREWKQVFYPDHLPNDAMLGYYAQRLPAVEINDTFYRMPRASMLEKWAAAVPEDFRFVVKASRRITHKHRLKDVREPIAYFAGKLDALGHKLGAVLFQLPPKLTCDMTLLAGFLDDLPDGMPAALEFRHPSWDDPEVHRLLARAGATLCLSEDQAPGEARHVTIAGRLYLRLSRPCYSDAELRSWIDWGRASGANSGYVFFKHEDEGAGPALAARFQALAHPRERRGPLAAGRSSIAPAREAEL